MEAKVLLLAVAVAATSHRKTPLVRFLPRVSMRGMGLSLLRTKAAI